MTDPLAELLPALEKTREGTAIRVKAVPGASRDKIAGLLDDRIKVRISAPPEAGRANAAIVQLLASALGVPRARVTIMTGSSSPIKTILVQGMAPNEVACALGSTAK